MGFYRVQFEDNSKAEAFKNELKRRHIRFQHGYSRSFGHRIEFDTNQIVADSLKDNLNFITKNYTWEYMEKWRLL